MTPDGSIWNFDPTSDVDLQVKVFENADGCTANLLAPPVSSAKMSWN